MEHPKYGKAVIRGWQVRNGSRAADLIVSRRDADPPAAHLARSGVPSPRDVKALLAAGKLPKGWKPPQRDYYGHLQILGSLVEIIADHKGNETWYPALKEPFTIWGTFQGSGGSTRIIGTHRLWAWLKLD